MRKDADQGVSIKDAANESQSFLNKRDKTSCELCVWKHVSDHHCYET